MVILDSEFQFDRHKLTYFFEANRRIDFRELVNELFGLYKTRIWMQQVDTDTITKDDDVSLQLAQAGGLLTQTSTATMSQVRGHGGISSHEGGSTPSISREALENTAQVDNIFRSGSSGYTTEIKQDLGHLLESAWNFGHPFSPGGRK